MGAIVRARCLGCPLITVGTEAVGIAGDGVVFRGQGTGAGWILPSSGFELGLCNDKAELAKGRVCLEGSQRGKS